MLQHNEQVGKLDRRITFQQKVYGTTKLDVTSWEDIVTVWASADEKSGSEPFEVEQQQAHTMTMFTIRFRSDITTENRIVYNSQYWDITSILEVGRKRFLHILAESGGQYVDDVPGEGDFAVAEFSSDFSV